MKKKLTKENVKKFYRENKTAIWVGIATGVGCYIGWKGCEHAYFEGDKNSLIVRDEHIKKVLIDMVDKFGDSKVNMIVGVKDSSINAHQLGELGELAIKKAAEAAIDTDTLNFTHFIMIGPAE